MKAAVFYDPHTPLTIENVDIAEPIELRCWCAR